MIAQEEVDRSLIEATAQGRRWPWVVSAAAIFTVVAVIVVAALLGTTGGRPGASVPGSTAAPASGGGSTQAAEAGFGGSGASSGPVALSGRPDDQARQQALTDYYALLPDRLDEDWQRLTPSFQRTTAGGLQNYRSFWGSMAQVTVRSVTPASGDEVDATVTYRYVNGREVEERTLFRLAFAGGTWKIDGQRQATG